MSSSEINPLELAAEVLGEHFYPEYAGRVNESDERLTKEIHIKARDYGIMNERYWVDSAQALVFPKNMQRERKNFTGSIPQFFGLKFAGDLMGYDKFSLGDKGAWCLRFADTILLPGFDELPERELWVPTVSGRVIERL